MTVSLVATTILSQIFVMIILLGLTSKATVHTYIYMMGPMNLFEKLPRVAHTTSYSRRTLRMYQ